MGYTAIPDKTAGVSTISEADWDTYLRDGINTGAARPLADTVLGASAATIDLTSIPATFAHLLLVAYLRSDRATAADAVTVYLNGDVSAVYDYQSIAATGAAPSAGEAFAASAANVAGITGGTAPANKFSSCRVLFPHYAGTTGHKAFRSRFARVSGTTTGLLEVGGVAGFWRSTSAINRITVRPLIGSNLVAGSRVTLYGLPL